MTFNSFITKWLGKKADFDGHYDGQCVDLFRYYVQEVLNLPQPKGVTGAGDFWTNYESDPNLKNYYEKIPNTPTGVPQKGDVMLWNKKAGGGFGHVSIFIEGTVNKFTSLDQNWPTLSKVTKTVHDYKNVYGWLRPKKAPIAPNPDALEACLKDHVMLVDKIEKELKPAIHDLETERDELYRANKTYREQQETLAKELDCPNQFPDILGKIEGLKKKEDDLTVVQDQNLDLQETITDNYVEEVKTTVFPKEKEENEEPVKSPAISIPSTHAGSFLEALLRLLRLRK